MLKKNLHASIFSDKEISTSIIPGVRDFVYDSWEKDEVSKNFLNDSSYRDLIIQGGFINNNSIDFPIYNINSNGFRSDEFNTSDNGIVCLGCSDSFGHWQYENKIWPYFLSKHFDQKCWNLSTPGADIGFNYLNFKKHSSSINFDKVFILIPSPLRRLTLVQRKDNKKKFKFKCLNPIDQDKLRKSIHNYGVDNNSIKLLLKYYVESSNTFEQDFYINSYLDSIANIVRKNNAKLYWLPNVTYFGQDIRKTYLRKIYSPFVSKNKALDGLHLGTYFQEEVANYFINLVEKNIKKI